MQRLLGSGKQAEALAFYQQAAGVSAAEAGLAIHNLARQLSARVILRQQLSPTGFLLLGLFGLGFLASLAALLFGWLPWWLAVLLVAVFFVQLYPYLVSLRTEWRLRGAKIASATILKFAPIGQFGSMHTFRAWVEVRPIGSQPFEAEMDLAVRKVNLASVVEGALIDVLYQPGSPPLVVYNGKPQQNSSGAARDR